MENQSNDLNSNTEKEILQIRDLKKLLKKVGNDKNEK